MRILSRIWWFIVTLTAPIWFIPFMLVADFVASIGEMERIWKKGRK